MPPTEVTAALQVQDGAAQRPLNVVDFRDPEASTEQTLAAVLARVGDVLTRLEATLSVQGTVTVANPTPATDVSALAREATLAQVRDALPDSPETGLAKEATLAQVRDALPASPETGLAKDSTLAQLLAALPDSPETGLAKDATLTSGAQKTAIYSNGSEVNGMNPLPTTSSFADENGVPFSAANPLPVDVGASIELDNVTVGFESVIAANQLPPGPLAANEVWTGPWEEVHNYASIAAVVLTDASSALNGVEAQFSADGTAVARSVATTIPANFGAFFELAPEARYFRIRYTNGPAPQTILRAQVLYRFNPGTAPIQPLGSAVTDANVGSVTRAFVAGREPTGAWRSLAVSSTGQLQVTGPLTDAQLRAAPVPVTVSNPTDVSALASESTLEAMRGDLAGLTPLPFPESFPLPSAQLEALTPPAPLPFPAAFPLPAEQVTDLKTVTVANPTANPETGLAKDATLTSHLPLDAGALAVRVQNPTAATETGLAKETTLISIRDRASFPLPSTQVADLKTVTVANPTANPETGLAKTVDVQAIRDRLPAALADDGSLATKDTYTTDEALPSQPGADGVLTFTFAAAMDLVWVRCQAGTGFARVTGTPANGVGIYCEDGVPQPITRRTTSVKVWAPVGSTVYVWGYGG